MTKKKPKKILTLKRPTEPFVARADTDGVKCIRCPNDIQDFLRGGPRDPRHNGVSGPDFSAHVKASSLEDEVQRSIFNDLQAPRFDLVQRPRHYNMGKIEVCDFIVDQNLDFLEGNVVKYVTRYKHKFGLTDLQKAKWYLNKLIKTVSQKLQERDND